MPKSVAHVTTWGVHCGVAKHLSYWLPHVRRPGVICAEHPPSWHSSIENWNTLPSVRCWRRGSADGLMAAALVAEEHNAGIIHLQWDPSFFSFDAICQYREWAAARGIRTVITAHVLLDIPVYTWETKAVLTMADQFVVGTPAMVEAFHEYSARFSLPLKRPVRWVPLAAPEMPDDQPAPYDGSPGPLILVWGFLGGLKGHAETVEAVRRLREFAPTAHLLIAGRAITGEQRQNVDRLRLLAKADPDLLEVREGFMADDDLYALCRSADCIVLNHQWKHPSSSGTIAISVASGTHVVVSQSLMFSGYVEAGAVKAVDAPGPDGLVDAILDILTAEHQLDSGRAEMMARIAAPAVAAQYESIYNEILGGNAA